MKYQYYTILVIIFLPQFCSAQSSIRGKIHLGYSNPTSLEKSYKFSAYEVEGKFSQNIYLAYERQIGRQLVRVQSGLSLLGFQTRQFNGFTPHPFFPSVKDGLPILSKSIYNLNYFDNSIGYGINMKSKLDVILSIHYLLNVTSDFTEIYSFTDASATNTIIYTERIDTDLKKKGYGFYNHFATSLELNYALSKNLKIGCNYLIGLSEFNPFLLNSRHNTRLNQSFSISLSHNFFRFRW